MGEGRKKSIPQVHSIRRTARSTDRRSFPSGFPGIPINNPPKDNERESEHNRGLILTQSVHVRRVILIVILVIATVVQVYSLECAQKQHRCSCGELKN